MAEIKWEMTDLANPLGLSVSVLESIESVAEVKDRWRSLLRTCAASAPNVDPDRYIPVTKSLVGHGVRPHVVLLENGTDLRAMLIARTCVRRGEHSVGYKRFRSLKLKSLDVVYGGLVCAQADVHARRGLESYLLSQLDGRKVDIVSINHVRLSDPVISSLKARVGRRMLPCSPEPHWSFQFDVDGWQSTFAKFSKKHRYNIRRAESKLSEHFHGDLVMEVVEDSSSLERFITQAADVARETYQASLGVGFEDSSLWRELLTAEISAGRLRCYLLVARGRTIAYQIGSIYSGRYILEAIGYRPSLNKHSPGSVLLLKSFENLSQYGVRVVDYGFGDAEYKRVYGTESCEEAVLRLYGISLPAQISWAIEVAVGGVVGCARNLLRRSGLEMRLKRWWRSRLSGAANSGKGL